MIKRIVHEVRRRPAYKWHRHIGILAAIFFVFLAVTGVTLNHTDALKLDRRYLANEWLLAWYGIEGELSSTSFPLNDGRWLTGTSSGLYLNEKRVAAIGNEPVGIAETGEVIVVATESEILLLTPTGKLIERGSGIVSGHIERLGVTGDGLAVAGTVAGQFLADRTLLEWKSANVAVNWSQAADAPSFLLEKVKKAERSRILSLERFFFDLHSGRLFGRWGPYFMDGIALLLLVLVGTGLYMSFAKRGQ